MSYHKLIYSAQTGEPSLSRCATLVAHVLAAVFFSAWNVALVHAAWTTGTIPNGLMELWLVYLGVAGLQYSTSKYLSLKGQKGEPTDSKATEG